MKRNILLFLLIFTISYIGYSQNSNKNSSEDMASSNLTRMSQVYYYLNRLYLDTINYNNVTDRAIAAIVKELDPHSVFIPAKEVKSMNEPLEGNFSGVGVEFAIIDDTLTVQAIVQGGPSEQVGILAGDKILSVDGEKISNTGLTIERVHKYLRGPEGSKVEIEIARKGENMPLNFTITRAKIPLNSLDASYEISPNILYLKLSRFSATSYEEIMEAVSKYNHDKGIILDLRGNGGGYLVAAIQIANEFLKKGQLIVYTEGRTVRRMNEYADGLGALQNAPVVMIIDENSASASEIVSGAIQDWDRGTIIGRRSFGKGLVQQQIPLNDGSQIRLTVARYHTPSGRVIQSPYKAGDAEDYYKAFFERYSSKGDIYNMDTLKFPDSLKYNTLVNKRVVYGGGGIMPDIYMVQDTSFYTKFYGELIRKGLFVEFVNHFLDNNRNILSKKYKTYDSFVSGFNPQENLDKEYLCTIADNNKNNKDSANSAGNMNNTNNVTIANSNPNNASSAGNMNNTNNVTIANSNESNFVKASNANKTLFDLFIDYSVSKGIKHTEQDILTSGPQINKYLKALVLKGLFDFNQFIKFLNTDDEEVLKALEVIKK